MRFQYEIHPEKRLIKEYFQGQVNLQSLIAAIKQVNSDPLYDRYYNGIVDLTGARMDLGFREVFNLVEYMKGIGNSSLGEWAFLAEDPLNFGVMRILHSLTDEDGMGIKIFRKPEDARAWQGTLISTPLEEPELLRETA